VVQDAYVSVYRSWTKLRNTDSAAAFLRAAVVNKARSVLRHRAVVDRNTPQAPLNAPSAEHEALVLLGVLLSSPRCASCRRVSGR
jgi:DNA-directed RNA polymerase specialized sigma24 family protein